MTAEETQKLLNNLSSQIKKLKKSSSSPESDDFKKGYSQGIADSSNLLTDIREELLDATEILIKIGIKT